MSSTRTRCWPAFRPGRTGLHAYFVHSFHLAATDRAALVAETNYGGPVTAMVGVRQHRGHAVPPGEEPDAGLAAHLQFPEVAALEGSARGRGRPTPLRPPWLQATQALGTQRHFRSRHRLRRGGASEPAQRRVEQQGVGLDLLDQQAVVAVEVGLEPCARARSARSEDCTYQVLSSGRAQASPSCHDGAGQRCGGLGWRGRR